MAFIRNYSRARIIGHILFWISSLAFAISAYYVASDHQLNFNINLLVRALIPNIGFAAAVYINLYLLVPKFLKHKSYVFYSFWLIVTLTIASLLVQALFVFLLKTGNATGQLPRMFSYHFFTAGFYVGITTLIKFVKDWLQLQEINYNFSRIEKEKLEAELNSLKSQINPHFLFNCLNNIYSLALVNSPHTPQLILKLSDLMRHVLYESRENFIPVRKEIEFVENFIELQRIRLSDKVNITFEINGEIPNKSIIPLIFEPFIDNAFKHGLRNPANKPFIQIHFNFTPDRLHFGIVNNYLESYHVPKDKSSGIGLKNVEKRLEYLYKKNEYDLAINKSETEFSVSLHVTLKD